MKPVEVNSSEDIRDLESRNIELGQEFHLSTRNLRIDV